MRNLRLGRSWLLLGWLLVGLVVWGSLTPEPPDPGVGALRLHDKLQHAFAYFLIMAWFTQIYAAAHLLRRHALGFIALGVVLELLQGAGGVRHMESADALAGAAGVAGGWLLSRTVLAHGLERLERALLTTPG